MAEAQLRQNLIKACEQGLDPSKIVPLCDRLLNASKNDPLGLRCKTIALLQSKRIAQATAVARDLANVTTSKKAAASGKFLLAMCLYRANNFEEAEETLLSPGSNQNGVPELNLLAQCRYNLFQYRKAAEIYERLLNEDLYQDDLERDEILTNLSACYASVAEVDKCLETTRRAEEENHYDLLFNYATALSQRGRFSDAKAVLADAERICIYSNEYQPDQIDFCKSAADNKLNIKDNKDEEKKFTAFVKDVVAIKVQQAYVAAQLNDRDTAEKILSAILTTPHSAILTGTVAHAAASLNWTALKRHSSFIDSYNKLRLISQPALAKRLTAEQRECAAYNNFLLNLGIGKQTQARALADGLIRDFPSGTLGPRALAAVVASSDPNKAESTLKKVFSSNNSDKNSDIHQVLTLAQLTLERGDVLGALDLISKNEEVLSQPSVITTVLAGYASLAVSNQTNKQICAAAEKSLDALLTSNKKISSLLSGNNINVDFALQVALKVYSRIGRHSDAASLLEKASQNGANDKTKSQNCLAAAVLEYIRARDISAATRVAAATSGGNTDKTTTAAKFTLSQTESTSLPRDKLTKAGFFKPSAAVAAASSSATDNKGGALVTADKGPRTRPRRRVPKNIDPAQKIDPERWIPWSMRTYVKDMPPRRRLEAKKRRAEEEAEKRKLAEKRKKEAAVASAASS